MVKIKTDISYGGTKRGDFYVASSGKKTGEDEDCGIHRNEIGHN
jgi:hypothetical protein